MTTTAANVARRVFCSYPGHLDTKGALIPKNRSRPNGWWLEPATGGSYRLICPACYRLHLAVLDRARCEAAIRLLSDWDEALVVNAREDEVRRLAAEQEAAAAKAEWEKLPEGYTSWAPEVIADRSGRWCGNALRFATRQEAEDNVRDLSFRWTLVLDTRTVPSTDPVNYTYGPEGLKGVS